MKELDKEGQASQRNPMTRVYKIVDGLKEYLEWDYRRKSKFIQKIYIKYRKEISILENKNIRIEFLDDWLVNDNEIDKEIYDFLKNGINYIYNNGNLKIE